MTRRIPTRVASTDLMPAGDYWATVTDVPCPRCAALLGGQVRWAEAGYVPGYRVCDTCGTAWMAAGCADRPRLDPIQVVDGCARGYDGRDPIPPHVHRTGQYAVRRRRRS